MNSSGNSIGNTKVTTGLDFVWAMGYLLDNERREANRQRDEELRAIIEQNLGRYGSPDNLALASSQLQKFRTFNDRDLDEAQASLGYLFPGLKELDGPQAKELIERVIWQVKEQSRKTFSQRTRISTVHSVLKAAEPGSLESVGEGMQGPEISFLQGQGEKIRSWVIENPQDFEGWVQAVLSHFIEFDSARRRSESEGRFLSDTNSSLRMYTRNFREWCETPKLFEQLRSIIASGFAQQYGESRLRFTTARKIRRSEPSNSTWTLRNEAPLFMQAPAAKKPVALEVVIQSADGSPAAKEWTGVPGEASVIATWIDAMLNIWGPNMAGAGFKVKCKVTGEQGVARIEFGSTNASDASRKVMGFVAASLS